MSILSIQGLSHSYRGRAAVRDIELTMEKGEIFGFLGPNGAGKTTTIRILLGFLRATRGEARIFGLDCWRESAKIKREIGYVPGDLRLYPWMNGLSALDLVGKVRGLDLAKPAAELMERFRLAPSVKVSEMSRGMRQKLGLIMALASRPQLLILDEPTSALDPLMQNELMGHLREMAAVGHTVFFSSHSLAEVEGLCDRIAILREGQIVADEPLAALRSRAGREVVVTTPEDCQLPPCLRVRERVGGRARCELLTPLADLLEWLRDNAVQDISIGPPNLEAVFRAYYDATLGSES